MNIPQSYPTDLYVYIRIEIPNHRQDTDFQVKLLTGSTNLDGKTFVLL